MSALKEPVRFSDLGGPGPDALGRAIRRAAAQDGDAREVASLTERLAPQLAAPTSAALTSSMAAGVSAGLLGGKWLMLLGVGGVALGLGLAQPTLRPQAPPSATPVPRPVAAPQVVPAALPVAETAPPPAAPEPVREVKPPALAPAKVQRKPRSARPLRPEAEMVLLERARVALEQDPEATLSLVEEHARAHRAGVFAQEREVLRIEAELKLRRDVLARQHAERFIERFPRSPHARRVRALLDRAAVLDSATTP